jgi:hypothetical protein
MAEAFPLQWPEGWTRTPDSDRRRAPYKTEPGRIVQNLRDELRRLGAVGAYVISSNIQLRRDGLPAADSRNPMDPGVAVYWSTETFKDRMIACDKWERAFDNMHAIALAIEAMRAIDRAGATQVVERAFSAFGALPASNSATKVRPWWEVLGFREDMLGALSVEVVDARFRELAKKAHPDKGGSEAAMSELNYARLHARKHYGAT